jgi:hypothetical protein
VVARAKSPVPTVSTSVFNVLTSFYKSSTSFTNPLVASPIVVTNVLTVVCKALIRSLILSLLHVVVVDVAVSSIVIDAAPVGSTKSSIIFSAVPLFVILGGSPAAASVTLPMVIDIGEVASWPFAPAAP